MRATLPRVRQHQLLYLKGQHSERRTPVALAYTPLLCGVTCNSRPTARVLVDPVKELLGTRSRVRPTCLPVKRGLRTHPGTNGTVSGTSTPCEAWPRTRPIDGLVYTRARPVRLGPGPGDRASF